MAKYGFLEVLTEELDQNFPYDYEINWDKRNHAVELSFILEVQNSSGVVTVDMSGEESQEDIFFEESLIFYNPSKSKFDTDDYLVAFPYLPKKGYSREFLNYLVKFLKETAEQGLDDLIDFLENPDAEEFFIDWNTEDFENGREKLVETDFYPYPRF